MNTLNEGQAEDSFEISRKTFKEYITEKKLKFDVDDVLVVNSKNPKKAYFTSVQGISEHGDYWLLDDEDYNSYEMSPKKIEKIAVQVGNKNSFSFASNVEGWIDWNMATEDRK